ncbi:isoprenoid synthase domain-containing protein [Amylocystis lapponica]|nr:isoprenoid synthase domain-containing protein [Amylocystis lapponica]
MSPESFAIPDLFSACPYTLRVNPNWAAVSAESEAWLLSGTDLSPKKQAALHGLKAAFLVAACYPDSDAYHLRVGTDFINYLFAVDDWGDEYDVEGNARLEADVMNAYRDPEGYQANSPAGTMAKDFMRRFLVTSGPRCLKRFLDTMDLFFKAVARQAEDRKSGDIPDLEDYIAFRNDTSGCKTCFVMDASNAWVTWSNDIFSYDVEQSRGDEHNMIAVLVREYGYTLQQAVDFVGNLCVGTIERFEKERLAVPSWGAEIDRDVAAYIEGLQNWIVGSLNWSFESMRYFGARNAEIRRELVVKLTPARELEKGSSV